MHSSRPSLIACLALVLALTGCDYLPGQPPAAPEGLLLVGTLDGTYLGGTVSVDGRLVGTLVRLDPGKPLIGRLKVLLHLEPDRYYGVAQYVPLGLPSVSPGQHRIVLTSVSGASSSASFQFPFREGFQGQCVLAFLENGEASIEPACRP
jgi:hypothetical protein